MKNKGKKERYIHLNAEFQRIARRDKKAFLSDQCKEIEENSRMGKTGDLFKKIRDTKGTSHAKTGSIKDRNGMAIFSNNLNEQSFDLGISLLEICVMQIFAQMHEVLGNRLSLQHCV